MGDYQQKFKSELQKLNQEQLLAVNSIEGPVMVIAGAGTGKTQTIALRIANILSLTQTLPSSILCLTFTDSAATNMRSRLLSIIGPLSYQVKIDTFHSFCNQLIKTYPDYFLLSTNLESLDDLTRLEIISLIIDQLPDGSLLKPWGDHGYYQKDIESNIQKLKRENITPDLLDKLITDSHNFVKAISPHYDQLVNLRLSKSLSAQVESICQLIINTKDVSLSLTTLFTYHLSLYHQHFYTTGPAKNEAVNFKNALIRIIDNLVKDIPKQKELLILYKNYQQQLNDRHLYDYDDMILFVNQAFTQHPEFLQIIQEKYQYVLVDEYQDTNSAQNKILDLLSSHFDRPNLFVVGDDDQSIFRFQGAAIENIFSFYQKYNPQIVVLRNNYRSHQLILDTSSSVINHNQNRITQYIKNLDKSLKSSVVLDPDPINLFAAPNSLAQNYYVVQTIKKLITSGVPPSEIAVLYRNNSDALDLVELLKNSSLPYDLIQDRNILNLPLIKSIINLLELVFDPQSNLLFYHLLNSSFTAYSPIKLYKFSKAVKKAKKSFIDLALSKKGRIKSIARRVLKANQWSQNLSPQNFFNKLIRRFGIRDFVLAKNDLNLISALHTLYVQIKQLSTQKDMSIKDIIGYLKKYQANNLSLVDHFNYQIDAVKLMTVHKAKGLEFQHLFIINATDGKWGNSRQFNTLRLPPGILKTEITKNYDDPNEEERRLFYVALTRAKSQIYITYSTTTDSGKSQLPCIFISEINPQLIQSVTPPDSLLDSINLEFSPPISKDQDTLCNYLKTYLATNYVLSPSHLNSYLRCPFCFYHQSILNIPTKKDKFTSFGTATHAALTYLYKTLITKNILINSSQFSEKFKDSLILQRLDPGNYQEALSRGQQNLTDYYQFYSNSFHSQVLVDYDFSPKHLHLDDIPITGRIDLIDQKDRQQITVVDFKTSNPDGKYKEFSQDGDYFRQLAFYILLTQLDHQFSPPATIGVIDFTQKSRQKNAFVKRSLIFTPQQIADLKSQINTVYHQILDLDFYHLGPNCSDDLGVHHFLR